MAQQSCNVMKKQDMCIVLHCVSCLVTRWRQLLIPAASNYCKVDLYELIQGVDAITGTAFVAMKQNAINTFK